MSDHVAPMKTSVRRAPVAAVPLLADELVTLTADGRGSVRQQRVERAVDRVGSRLVARSSARQPVGRRRLAADEQDVHLLDRPERRAVLAEPDLLTRLAWFAEVNP